MKPSTLRYIRTEQDVWAFLWRIMPKAVKELQSTKQLNKYETQNNLLHLQQRIR